MSSSINIHDVFVPLYLRALRNTSHILSKGISHSTASGIPEASALSWRLAPDMNPLSFQIQNICNIAQNLIIVVLGTPLPNNEVKATTFADLQARLQRTIELLENTTREQFEGRDEASVTVRELGARMEGLEYVQEYGMPNFYFHVGMVYALFRSHGAPIGKWDYLRGGK